MATALSLRICDAPDVPICGRLLKILKIHHSYRTHASYDIGKQVLFAV